MSRWVFVLLVAGFLSGCMFIIPEEKELSPVLPESVEAQQQEIHPYLDAFLASGDPATLDKYLADAPDSKQRDAMKYSAHELRKCRAAYAERKAELKSKNQLVADLEGKNQQLRETIEQLKSLLIQLEQRAH